MSEPTVGRSGKRKKASKPPIDPAAPVSLRWDLAELPSSQHRAGLAGLALCVQFLERKSDRRGVCAIEVLDESGLTLRVDRAGMQELFDDVYAASLEEQERDKKFTKKTSTGVKVDVEPRTTRERIETDKKGIAKAKVVYVYDQVVPRGELVSEWDAVAEGAKQLWLKLWRDLVWSALRAVPATREAYNARAEGRAANDGGEAWDELIASPTAGVDLPSTYYLGAQARSAENVSFRDLTRFQFLLHFWPFVVPIYVPAVVGRDGERTFEGFAVVVPDVAVLDSFVAAWGQVVRERGGEAAGYRPRDAIVDVAGEAGLDVARRAFAVVGRLQGAAASRPWLTAVDVFHLEKDGNNVRLRTVTRLDLKRERADDYGRVRREYWSPLFRRRRIINILEAKEWWAGFGRTCATSPQVLTIEESKFRHDCRIAFTEVEMTEASHDGEKTLEQLIYQVTRSYVFGRLGTKYDLDWAKVKGTSAEKDYNDKKEKVAREAFLAVRSRTGRDFVNYFTSTLCSVAQHVGESGYLQIARALHNEGEIERVRSLTLLALSANA